MDHQIVLELCRLFEDKINIIGLTHREKIIIKNHKLCINEEKTEFKS